MSDAERTLRVVGAESRVLATVTLTDESATVRETDAGRESAVDCPQLFDHVADATMIDAEFTDVPNQTPTEREVPANVKRRVSLVERAVRRSDAEIRLVESRE